MKKLNLFLLVILSSSTLLASSKFHLNKECKNSQNQKLLEIFNKAEPKYATPLQDFLGHWQGQDYLCDGTVSKPYLAKNFSADTGFISDYNNQWSWVDRWSNSEKAWMYYIGANPNSNLRYAYRILDKDNYIIEKRDTLLSGSYCQMPDYCIYGYALYKKISQ